MGYVDNFNVRSTIWCIFISGFAGIAAQSPRVTDVVVFEMTSGGQPLGRIVIGLFGEVVPKTTENFRVLASGEKGFGYQGSKFHRVIQNFMLQGGDYTRGDGTGGNSIYGPKFADENFQLQFTRPGQVAMANSGPNTNGAQFFITTGVPEHLNGKHVIFGEVIDGMNVVHQIDALPTGSKDKPLNDVIISRSYKSQNNVN